MPLEAVFPLYNLKRLLKSQVHALRHPFAKTMEEAGAKVSEIQSRLGHTSLAVTGHYLARLNQSKNRHVGDLSRLYGLGLPGPVDRCFSASVGLSPRVEY